MDFYSLLLIALALSLDAFGVALSIGLNRSVRLRSKLIFCLSFGLFQFLFSYAGTYAGVWFTKYIRALPGIIGGIVIVAVGAMMIKEGLEEKEECLLFNPKMYIVLGASVSIDALVVGFTAFNNVSSNISIFMYTVYIGIVTFIMTAIAFIISKYLNKISAISKYADYLGGVILIIFGIRMIFFS
jgi:manganese efflux pump family protein